MKKLVLLLLPLAFAVSPAHARNYDCSKPGNARKAACKGNAAKAAPMAPAMAAPEPKPAAMARPRNYDCTKLGNKFRAACRGQNAVAPASQMAASPAVSSQPSSPMRGGDKATHAGGPNGATAMCKDGTYSHSAHHSGTCSGHHGVGTWY
jgi:hypothetical protein